MMLLLLQLLARTAGTFDVGCAGGSMAIGPDPPCKMVPAANGTGQASARHRSLLRRTRGQLTILCARLRGAAELDAIRARTGATGRTPILSQVLRPGWPICLAGHPMQLSAVGRSGHQSPSEQGRRATRPAGTRPFHGHSTAPGLAHVRSSRSGPTLTAPVARAALDRSATVAHGPGSVRRHG